MAAYEVLLLNTAIPQIQAAQSGDTYVVPRDIAFSAALTLSAGTANGVPYLSSPGKVLTTGSALTFDGTTFVSANTQIGLHSMRVYNGSNASAGDGAGIQFGVNGSNIYGRLWTDNNSAAMYFDNLLSTPFIWRISGTSEQMRLTSTGLGIGTSSPGVKLDVRAAAAGIYLSSTTGTNQAALQVNNSGGDFYFGLDNSTGNNFNTNTAYAGVLWRSGANPICFVNNSAERMRLDSSGNLGLGVTPSAWGGSGVKAFDVSTGASFSGSGSDAGMIANAYYDGSNWRYKATSLSIRYQQIIGTGTHAWFTAPSGNANDPITFTQAMTLDASGKLLVGTTTSPNQQTVIYRTSATTSHGALLLDGNGNYAGIQFAESGNLRASLAVDNSALYLTHESVLAFKTGSTANVGGTERARITSGGEFQVSSGGSVQVGGTAARATTAGTNRLDIFDGTAPVGTLANGISIYSSSGEAYVMDAAGNATLFSPHDAETNEWIFKSKHTPTGKVLKIDVERLLKFVNDHFGLDAVHEFIEE